MKKITLGLLAVCLIATLTAGISFAVAAGNGEMAATANGNATEAERIGTITDVTGSDWFYDDVKYIVENNILDGTSADTFSPNAPMTREILVSMLYRVHGEPGAVADVDISVFSDVPDGSYYASAIRWAAGFGVINGIGNNLFAPEREISRQDIAVILERYIKYAKIDAVVNDMYCIFSDDSQISDYAKSSVQTMYKLGILMGKEDNRIDPQGTATRAEVSAMVHRLLTGNFSVTAEDDILYNYPGEIDGEMTPPATVKQANGEFTLSVNKADAKSGNFTLANNTDNDVIYGSDFILKDKNGENVGNWAFNSLGLTLKAHESISFDVDFVAAYFDGTIPAPLASGTYTLEKRVNVGVGEIMVVSTQFAVE